MTTRRSFLERLAAGTSGIALGTGAIGIGDGLTPQPLAATAAPTQGEWDMTWRDKVTGPHKLLFDGPELEDGAAIFRSVLVGQQYRDVFGLEADQISSVLVIRYRAISLIMNQAFWDRFELGKELEVKDMEEKPTTLNPALPREGATGMFARFNLPSFLETGGIVLACNLAFREPVSRIAKAEGLKGAEARARTLEFVIPGVIMQPSGVFATAVAQELGCQYIRAST